MMGKVKQLNIGVPPLPCLRVRDRLVFRAEGAALLLQATNARSGGEVDRLVQLGNEAFSQAVVSTTNPRSPLLHWGDLLLTIALTHGASRPRQIELLKLATSKFAEAVAAEPTHAHAIRQLYAHGTG